MLTIITALAALACCTAARWYLDRTSRRETEHAGGRICLRAMRNGGAAFGLPIRKEALPAASLTALGMLWTQRRRSPVGVGLALGGGLSNLLERLRRGSVYDYLQFPQSAGAAEALRLQPGGSRHPPGRPGPGPPAEETLMKRDACGPMSLS